jgi:hypothetical protein
MIPAIAISGSMKSESPEIMISGMAKPTAPFTNPAISVTPKATAKAQAASRPSCREHERPFRRCDIVIPWALQRKNARRHFRSFCVIPPHFCEGDRPCPVTDRRSPKTP